MITTDCLHFFIFSGSSHPHLTSRNLDSSVMSFLIFSLQHSSKCHQQLPKLPVSPAQAQRARYAGSQARHTEAVTSPCVTRLSTCTDRNFPLQRSLRRPLLMLRHSTAHRRQHWETPFGCKKESLFRLPRALILLT